MFSEDGVFTVMGDELKELIGTVFRPTPEGRKDVMPRHFGMLVPSTNTTCEIEFCRLPAELQVHTGRLGKGGNTPFSPSLAPT